MPNKSKAMRASSVHITLESPSRACTPGAEEVHRGAQGSPMPPPRSWLSIMAPVHNPKMGTWCLTHLSYLGRMGTENTAVHVHWHMQQ